MEIKIVKGVIDSNTFVVRCGDALFLVDAGAKLNDVKKVLGRKPDAVLLTHEHFDHTFNIADYLQEFDCAVYCHAATAEELRDHDVTLGLGLGRTVKTPKSFDKFRTIEKDCVFKLGGTQIEAITAPGHSVGCVLYKVGGALFTGDVLFEDDIGRTDFIPNGPELMLESLKKLQSIEFETAYHGHGENSSFKEQQKNIQRNIG